MKVKYKFTLKLAYYVFFNTSPRRCNSEYPNLKKNREKSEQMVRITADKFLEDYSLRTVFI